MSSAWELHTFVWLLELGEVQGRTNTKADCAVPVSKSIGREIAHTKKKSTSSLIPLSVSTTVLSWYSS